MVSNSRKSFLAVLVMLISISSLLSAVPAESQGCFEHEDNLNYTPADCTAIPIIDRVFRLQTVTWKNHEYLFVDEGNEIKIMNIDSPLNPTTVTFSNFNITNVGDSDYDMVNFTVCDDCRYGMANYKAATVLFDLGTGGVPSFVGQTKNFDARLVLGGFTFKHNTQQYLVAASQLGNNCSGGNDSALHQFNGINEAGNPFIECIDNGGNGAEILNGLYMDHVSPAVIYMSEKFDQFRIYEVQTSPVFSLDYVGTGGIARANMSRGYGVAVDEGEGLMAVANFGVLYMYDIGFGSGSPATPSLITTKTLPTTQDQANAVALKYPIVHVAQQYTTDEPLTYDVTNPSNPVSLDQDFWDPSHAWNSLGSCLWNNHVVFADGGEAMYLSRYSSLQVIDPTACLGPVQPTANLGVNPHPAFPGDTLTVTNTSVGGEEFATWITDGADPHSSNFIAGSISFSSDTSFFYVLPSDMASSAVYYAHAAVQTAAFQYDPGGTTPEQIKTQQIVIDRTPQATITVTPPSVVTGDTVTLTAVAEGNPGGLLPFDWLVTTPPPTSAETQYEGNPVNGVVLGQSGDWTFDVAVNYEHDAPGQPGVPYQTTAQLIKNISSVSASFVILPAAPLHNQVITLTSSSAASADATLYFNWDVLEAGTTNVVDNLSFCDGAGPVNDQCVIPAETLTWDTYDFRLILTNTATDPDDVSVALIEDFEIDNGSILIDFTWAPTSPEIGQWVGFQVTGISFDDIEQAVWSFGGVGCDGTTSYTCVSPSFPGCDVAAFAYASGGTKTVGLTVTTTGGVVQPQVSNAISVSSSGSCGGTTCTYAVSPTSRDFSDAGGLGSFTVSTQTGCSWTASESASWVSITSGASGSGNGTVTYQVSANTGAGRSVNITAGGQVHTVNQTSAGPCGQGLVADDGTAENAYGWGTGNTMVQKFTPDVYPFVFTDVCAAFTQAGGDATLGFDVLVYDDDGPGGGPGTLLGTVPATLGGVPAWPDHTFVSVGIEDAGVMVNDGSVFIGAGWDESTEVGFYVAADESLGTPIQTGYHSNDGVSWESLSSAFPGYRSLLVRADGFSPVDGEWEQVVGSIFGGGNGFGDPSNVGASTMALFDGALFVGTENEYGGEVDYTVDGEDWNLGNSPGFNDSANDAVAKLISFGPHLYASTLNPVNGTQIWRMTAPLAWTNVEGDGFGDADNVSAPSGSVFDGGLFFGTNHSSGCEIWRTPDGVSWAQVHTNGFGSAQNEVAESMAVFNGALNVGTRNIGGAEIWRSPDGFVWFPVMTGGFGSSSNVAITDLVVFDYVFYAGVSNSSTGAQIWRSFNGTSWQQVVGDGFGDPGNSEFDALSIGASGLLAAVSGPSNPGAIWRSLDGIAWNPFSSAGFTDSDNSAVEALHLWEGRVFAGTVNQTSGCEVWRGGFYSYPFFEDGFESGDTGAWSAVVPLTFEDGFESGDTDAWSMTVR